MRNASGCVRCIVFALCASSVAAVGCTPISDPIAMDAVHEDAATDEPRGASTADAATAIGPKPAGTGAEPSAEPADQSPPSSAADGGGAPDVAGNSAVAGTGGDAGSMSAAAGAPAAVGGSMSSNGAAGAAADGGGLGDAGIPSDAGRVPDPEPSRGAVCSSEGRMVCVGPRESLRCQGAVWTETPQCIANERCAVLEGVCRPVVEGCVRPGDRICLPTGDAGVSNAQPAMATCAPDLTSTEGVTPCTGSRSYCVDGACVAGKCDPPPSDNRLANSDFGSNTGGWIISGDASIRWDGQDMTNCDSSGSIAVAVPSGKFGWARYCINMSSVGERLRAVAYSYDGSGTEARIAQQQWQEEDCTGAGNGASSSGVHAPDANGWSFQEIDIEIHPGTRSFEVQVEPTAGGTTLFDRVYVVPDTN